MKSNKSTKVKEFVKKYGRGIIFGGMLGGACSVLGYSIARKSLLGTDFAKDIKRMSNEATWYYADRRADGKHTVGDLTRLTVSMLMDDANTLTDRKITEDTAITGVMVFMK